MSDIEMRAHLLTVEYLRIAYQTKQLPYPLSAEVYVCNYKTQYAYILSALKASPKF